MEFLEKFKTYSNTDLLRIMENPDDYQPQATETAKTVFSERQLSESEIKIAKDELESERQEKSKKEQQKKVVENKVKNAGKSVFEQINPIQKEKPTLDKTITIISILFGSIFLFLLYKEFGMLKYMFTDYQAKWDFSTALYFLPLIIILIAAILFYRRKKTSWILSTIFLTYSVVSIIVMFIMTETKSISAPNILFPLIPLTSYILGFLFLAGIIWVICKEKIRIVYSISKPTMFLTIGIVTLIVVLSAIASV